MGSRDDEQPEDDSFVEEAGELIALVKRVTDSNGASAIEVYQPFRHIVSSAPSLAPWETLCSQAGLPRLL
jgi:hypothetical protein